MTIANLQLASFRLALESIHAQARSAEFQLHDAFETRNTAAETLATAATSRVAIMIEEFLETVTTDAG